MLPVSPFSAARRKRKEDSLANEIIRYSIRPLDFRSFVLYNIHRKHMIFPSDNVFTLPSPQFTLNITKG